MTTLPFVLHHYEASPYAEKIRLMFGVAGAPWQSLLSPAQPPRPHVDPLTGGYRRIPVAQIGADIFCDTALIAIEVAARLEHAELAPVIAQPLARELAEQAEGEVFFAAIGSVPPWRLLTTLLLNFGVRGSLRFIKDRSGMMEGSSVKPLRGVRAVDAMVTFQTRLDEHLALHRFVAGEQVSYADFCAYHPLWLRTRVGRLAIGNEFKHVKRWFAEIESIGHGQREEVGVEAVFAQARDNAPRALPESNADEPLLGQRVVVAPADYGRDPVTGIVVGADEQRWIIARDSDAFGTVHVHFPRSGYDVVAQ